LKVTAAALQKSTDSDNVAREAAEQSWPTWLVNQERVRGRILLALLIPVSIIFLLTDLRLEGPDRILFISMRAVYVILMLGALVALYRSSSPTVIRGWAGAGALGIAVFCCLRYGLGYGAGGSPGHLATDVVVMLALYMFPLQVVVQVIATGLVSLASLYGYVVWQGIEGAAVTLLVLTLVLAHTLGLGGSIALRRGLRQRYEALRELHAHMVELDKAESALERLAYYDPLTDLPNRALLLDRLQHLVARSERYGGRFALFYIDLDRFKFVNDTLGHAAGDALLREAASRMQALLRRSDTLARLGGDEFTLVVEDVRVLRDLDTVAAKIIEAMQQVFVIENREIFINASVGISVYPDDGIDVATLTRNADTAMYQAKQAGRGRFMFYAPAMNAENERRMRLEARLRRAVERQEFLLHFQPRTDLASRRIRSFEALLRWQDPHEGLIPPGEFVPLAEETGLIVPIGYWVIEAACRQLREWHDLGYGDLGMSINLSARQFQDPELTERVARTLAELHLPPDCVEFELTESILMSDADWSLGQLARLRALQVTIAVDDFGMGYSSLSYLKRFPIHALKIDRTFVSDVVNNPEDAAIVRAVISLAAALRLDVVAEGIETDAQHEFLLAESCREGQGYLYGRPARAAEALRMLELDRRARPVERSLRIVAPAS
jgi:diguanylate cyclase (GGDEF)-like protein